MNIYQVTMLRGTAKLELNTLARTAEEACAFATRHAKKNWYTSEVLAVVKLLKVDVQYAKK